MSNDLEESMTMASRHSIGNWPHVLNMANSIIGVSVLALPFCFKQCGILLGFLLLMGSAWLTRLTCHLLMKSAFATKKRSYEYLAFHIFGRAGKLLVELSIIGLLIGTCIAFYIIIGDLGPAVVSKVTGLENTPQLRSVLLVLLTSFIVLPLAMLHSLDSLSNFSAVSLTFYCVFVAEVVIAAFPNLWSGIWMSKVVFWNTDGVFKCLPIFALCFACQTQLFMMSDALPEPSLNRINRIVHSAVVMCSVIYVSVGCFGYIAFCDDYISGDILMNFSPTFFSEAIKLGFVTSTLISFPLVIFPCRASLYTLLFVRESNGEPAPEKGLHENFGGAVYIPPSYFKGITVSIIGVTLTIGLLVPNIEFMLAITGATMGSLICYILPAVLFITAISVDHGGNTRSFAQLVLLIGVTILIASSYVTLTGEDKVVKHESVVKLGQPIEHDEGNLPIHNDEELKKKLKEMKLEEIKRQLAPVNEKLDGIIADTGGVINKGVEDAVTAVASPSPKQEVIDRVTALQDVIDKNKLVDAVDNSKQGAVVDGELPEKEDDKRKEPPNPHAPVEELIVQEKIGDLNKDSESLSNQTKEDAASNGENRDLVERSIDSEPKKTAGNQLDAKVSQPMEVQQQALYGRPALVVVIRPKLENQSVPHGGKETANEKAVESKESRDRPKAKSAIEKSEVPQSVGKVVEGGEMRLDEAQDNSLAENLGRPMEVHPMPETRLHKAEEEPAVQKDVHIVNKSANVVDVADKAPDDRHAGVVDHHEAKIIIEELKKQQQEQRKLLDEHRKIIDDLKRHQIEVHQEVPNPNLKEPGQAIGENMNGKASESVLKEQESKNQELPDKEKKPEKGGAKVASIEERVRGERAVVNDLPKDVKESNKNQLLDDSNRQLKENKKAVKKDFVEMENVAKENVNIQDSNDLGNKNRKSDNVDKNAPEKQGHSDRTLSDIGNSQDAKILKRDTRNIDGGKQVESDHKSEILLKEKKLDNAVPAKLTSDQMPNRPEENIPVFVSNKS